MSDENKVKQDSNKYDKAMQWTTEQVVDYLQNNGFKDDQECLNAFETQKIIGSDLPLIDKDDLRDMGFGVGQRARLMRLLGDFKISAMVAQQSRELWAGVEWQLCPCWPIYRQHYTLSQTALTLRKGRCFGQVQDRIDLSSIQNIDLFEECICSTVKIASDDATSPYIEIKLPREKGKEVFQIIRDAWEVDQQTLASARFMQ